MCDLITFGDEVLSDFSDRDHGLDAHSQLALIQRQDVVEGDGHFVALVLNTNSRSRVSELDGRLLFGVLAARVAYFAEKRGRQTQPIGPRSAHRLPLFRRQFVPLPHLEAAGSWSAD